MLNADKNMSAWMEKVLIQRFPLFSGIIAKQKDRFGDEWAARLNEEVSKSFLTEAELEAALVGYGQFSLEALRLQKKFDRHPVYVSKSYDQAAAEVYFNEDYMMKMYLPGLLLSHYLWPHHYQQQLWMEEHFLPLVQSVDRFCDVGIGSGFYSKFMLTRLPHVEGFGFDISPFSMGYAERLMNRWNVGARFHGRLVKIEDNREPSFPCFMSIEVLEHLEDPIAFLKSLASQVISGSYGVITAAVDAPNRDHIFLYRTLNDISIQLEAAQFKIIRADLFEAFETSSMNPTSPKNACFIVQAT